MTDQQPDDKKNQDVESELTVDDLEDLLESELPCDEPEAADMAEDVAQSADDPEDLLESEFSNDESDASDLIEEAGKPAADQEDLLGSEFLYDELDESDLIDDIDEPVIEPLIKSDDQHDSYDLPAEADDFPDLDLPLEELPESKNEESDLEDIEDDLAHMSGWENPAVPEAGTTPASVPAPEAVAPAPRASKKVSQPEQAPKHQSGIIGVTLGVVGMLMAAAAIWLNMGLSDQLGQLKVQQKALADDASSQQSKDIRQLEQQVEKLKWLQGHQAVTQQSNLDVMQQQLNDLTTVVANKVAKQWRTGIKTKPVISKAKAVPRQSATVIPAPASTAKVKTKIAKQSATVIPAPVSIAKVKTAKPVKVLPISPDKALQKLVVTSGVGNIRSTASTDGIILYKLKKGTVVGKVSQSGSWIKVRLENGIDAWAHQIIFKSAVDKTETGPSEAVQPSVKKPTKLEGAVKTGWVVNLVSVESVAVAEKQVAYYQSRGIQAEYARTPAKGKIWYRVRVVGFANEKEAITYKNMLAKKYSISSWYNRM